MASRSRRRPRRPARPLFGYRDIGAPDQRHDRRAVIRAWVILALMIAIYLAIALTVYFVEPGLR
jgi:predicted secreted protein